MGRYLPFTGTSRLSVFADRLEIDRVAIYYPYLLEAQELPGLGAYPFLLELAYVAADATRVELWFAFQSLVPGRSRRRLDDFCRLVTENRAQFAASTAPLAGGAAMPQAAGPVAGQPAGAIAGQPAGPPAAAPAPLATATVRSGREAGRGGRRGVVVHSARIAFPPCCPVCGGEPLTVATLGVAADAVRFLPFGAPAAWFVPVCPAHRRLGDAIVVEGWSVSSSDVHFSFANAAYAERFLAANAADAVNTALPRPADGAPGLAAKVTNGTRFVLYLYVAALILPWIFRFSEVYEIPPGADRRARGLRYSVATALLGWWSLSTPIVAIRALAVNHQGGLDVSSNVLAAARGEALLPHRGNVLDLNRALWWSRTMRTPDLVVGPDWAEPYSELQSSMARLHEEDDAEAAARETAASAPTR